MSKNTEKLLKEARKRSKASYESHMRDMDTAIDAIFRPSPEESHSIPFSNHVIEDIEKKEDGS